MCGRVSRSKQGLDYVVPLFPDAMYPPDGNLFKSTYNVAPGTRQPVIYPDGPRLEYWGYRPVWAVARKVPMMVNARLDKAGTGTWKALFKSHRVLVPVDGWFEWVVEEGKKQPYYITPIDGQPLYLAGLTTAADGVELSKDYGYVIVTDAARGGLLDVHDRRPLAFSVEEAREWLAPSTNFEKALHLANNAVTQPDDFRWFRVSPAVNKVGNDDPSFNVPIDGDYSPS